MPAKSEKQRRFIYAKASQGKPWARDFIRHSGHTPPPIKGAIRKHLNKNKGR